MRPLIQTQAYHEIDGRATTEDMGTGDNCTTASQPLRWSRVVECSSLAIQLHVPRVNTRTVYPRVVEIGLSSFN